MIKEPMIGLPWFIRSWLEMIVSMKRI
jgi:hypothetical protein